MQSISFQSPCGAATCSAASLPLSTRWSCRYPHILFSWAAASCFCVLTVYVSLIFTSNEIRLRPITLLFAHHWVSIRHNQNLISQANTITRSVSQFGFEMNCGNELWQDWWSVQTGLTQCDTHIHLPTTRPHGRITLYLDINCWRELNVLWQWDIQELFRYPTLHRMVIIVLFQ